MKTRLKNRIRFHLLLVIFFPLSLLGQDVTGIWKGYFVTDGGQSYRLEFQIEQNINKTVTGVSYSYGNNIEFYGKATMTGRYTRPEKTLLIQEIRTVEVKSAEGGTCIMNYRFVFSKSGNEEYLEGTYVGKKEDRINPNNNGQWGDCGGGRCFLRRVQNSDFYVEPFLRNKTEPRKDSVVVKRETPAVVKPQAKPQPKTQIKTPSKPITNGNKKTVAVQPNNKKAIVFKKDTQQKRNMDPVVIKPVDKPNISVPVTTRSRQNELKQTFTVTSEEIYVRFYDNGEVDDDTISVYLDGKPIVTNKRLSTVPITFTIKHDPNIPEHTLVMVAENMGRIPPNTSLMIVQDGDKRYQASITSTEQKNAMVRFRYDKK